MTVEATRRLDDDEKGLTNIQTPGGIQSATYINEAGVCSLTTEFTQGGFNYG